MKLLLLGADGQVGWELRRALALLGEVVASSRSSGSVAVGDLEQLEPLRTLVRDARADVIVNAAAYTAVDAAETDQDRARVINATAPGMLAEEAARAGSWLVHYSTDYVFDGSGERPWRENDAVAPLNAYGRTKLKGEELIRSSGCRHLIFRTSWVYASRGKNFLKTMLKLAGERDALKIVDDQHGAPTGAELIADVTAHTMRSAVVNPALSGTYHLVAGGETTWYRYARHAIATARAMGVPLRVNDDAITSCATTDFPSPAHRPHNSRLSTAKLRATFGLALPEWQVGVERAITELLKP